MREWMIYSLTLGALPASLGLVFYKLLNIKVLYKISATVVEGWEGGDRRERFCHIVTSLACMHILPRIMQCLASPEVEASRLQERQRKDCMIQFIPIVLY